MTQEDKELLLKDLCSRLPYGVMCRMSGGGFETVEDKLTAFGLFQFVEEGLECVPYLRPMSSMTDEEDLEFIGIGLLVVNYGTNGNAKHKCKLSIPEIDWLNARHFDYRGLIKQGLALEAPEGMY